METEEQLMARLPAHPNVCRLLHVAETGAGRPNWLVYEHLSHGDLGHVLRKGGLSWRRRIHILAGVSRGLRHLHTMGPAVHHDISASNIGLGLNFEAKLLDCGGAILIDLPANEMRSDLPTVAYSEKQEVFSFGILIYVVLTGREALTDDPEWRSRNKVELRALVQGYRAQGRHQRLEELIDDSGPGRWAPDALDQLLQLAEDCTHRTLEERPRMEVVMRRLLALTRKYPLGVGISDREEGQRQRERLGRILPAEPSDGDATNERRKSAVGDVAGPSRPGPARPPAPPPAPPPLRTCCLCLDEVDATQGIVCGGMETEPHFTCNGCFSDYITNLCGDETIAQLARHAYEIYCPAATNAAQCDTCPSRRNQPFSHRQIAEHTKDEVIGLYIRKTRDYESTGAVERQRRIWAEDMERREAQRLQEEIQLADRAAAAARAHEAAVQRLEQRIINEALTLKCPGCKVVFLEEWDGCGAVRCQNCDHDFCGFCTAGPFRDGHAHLFACELNAQLRARGAAYGVPPRAMLQAAHREVRIRQLKVLVAESEYPARTIWEALQRVKHLAGHNIRPTDVMEEPRAPPPPAAVQRNPYPGTDVDEQVAFEAQFYEALGDDPFRLFEIQEVLFQQQQAVPAPPPEAMPPPAAAALEQPRGIRPSMMWILILVPAIISLKFSFFPFFTVTFFIIKFIFSMIIVIAKLIAVCLIYTPSYFLVLILMAYFFLWARRAD